MCAVRKISVVGHAGNAAGKHLGTVTCDREDLNASRCAKAAIAACHQNPQCDTVEIVHKQLANPDAVALLRSSYTNWSTYAPSNGALAAMAVTRRLHKNVGLCQQLARKARSVLPGESSTRQDRISWMGHFCEEYAAAASDSPPPLGVAAPAVSTSQHHYCLPPDATLRLLTYANRATPWMCRYLRTLAYEDAEVTIIGWEPNAFRRPGALSCTLAPVDLIV